MALLTMPRSKRLWARTPLPIDGLALDQPPLQGLQAWWLVEPWQMHTFTWLDLLQGLPGTLTSMGIQSQTAGWSWSDSHLQHPRINFDGSATYVNLGTPFNLNLPGDATIVCGLYPRTTAGGIKYIVSNFNNTGNLSQYSIGINRTAGKVEALANNSTIAVTSTAVLAANFWCHIAWTRQGSSFAWTHKIYVNGILDASASIATNPDAFQTTTLGRAGAFNGLYYQGGLDSVMFYNRALSPDEINALFTAWVTGHPRLLRRQHRYVPVFPASSRTLTPSPAKAQWQTQTPTLGRAVLCQPAQAQWQANRPVITLSLQASPAKAQWQASRPTLPRAVTCQPAQAQWQANRPVITLSLQASPAKAQWQAPTPVLTRTVSCSPAQAQWQTQTPTLGRAVLCQPAQAQWQANRPVITLSLQASPAKAQWQASRPTLPRAVTCQPVQAQWQAPTSTITTAGRSIVCQGAQAQWQASTPVLTRTVSCVPTQMQGQAPASRVSRALVCQPVQGVWQACTPVLTRSFQTNPAQARWQVSTPILTRFVLCTPAQALWQTGELRVGRVGSVIPAQAQWQAPTAAVLGPNLSAIGYPAQGQYMAPTPVVMLVGAPFVHYAPVVTVPIHTRLSDMDIGIRTRASAVVVGFT